MLVFDITNEKSFDNIKNWIRNIEEVLVAKEQNKSLFISIYVLISCVSIVALKSSCFAYAVNLDALALANDSCTFWGCMILVKLMINVSRVGQKCK